MALLLRVLLAAVLVAAALFKLWSGHEPRYLLPEPVFYGAALGELCLGALLLTRHVALGALGAAALFAGGVGLGAVANGPCGCLGSAAGLADPATHVLIAGLCGILASVVYLHAAEARARALACSAG